MSTGPFPASFVTWTIAASTVAAMFVQPRRIPEAIWACVGAGLLLVCHLISFFEALGAITKGYDVYLFLTGMMVLAELARRENVFDWLAGLALRAAAGSRARLFTLIYLVGIAVTTVLSNDATAVVLTPAVYAVMKRAKGNPLPYVFACALIANAASFVLPISNPANLVTFDNHLPPLVTWLRIFLLPAGVAIVATYLAMRFLFRKNASRKGLFQSRVHSTFQRRQVYGARHHRSSRGADVLFGNRSVSWVTDMRYRVGDYSRYYAMGSAGAICRGPRRVLERVAAGGGSICDRRSARFGRRSSTRSKPPREADRMAATRQNPGDCVRLRGCLQSYQ